MHREDAVHFSAVEPGWWRTFEGPSLLTSAVHCRLLPRGKCVQDPTHILNHPACGWTNNDFALYSSPDLSSWSLVNPSLLPSDKRPNGIYFRPKVLHNTATKRWVLWFNFVTEGTGANFCNASWARNFSGSNPERCHSTYGTAVSATVDGPFSIHTLPVVMGASKLNKNPGWQHGDFGLFIDEGSGSTGTGAGDDAYIVYNSYDAGGANVIDRLTPDYTGSTGVNSGYLPMPGGTSGEAQAMVKHNNSYFAVFGHYCCFCAQGSSAVVHKAQSPLGPYQLTGTDIQRNKAAPSPPSPPPPPSTPGPLASAFCGGVGGRETAEPTPAHDQLQLRCAVPGATISNITYARYGTDGCVFSVLPRSILHWPHTSFWGKTAYDA